MNDTFILIESILRTYVKTSDVVEDGLGIFVSEHGVTLEMEEDICTIGDFYPLCNLVFESPSGILEVDEKALNLIIQ